MYGMGHPSEKCSKSVETPPKCVNCVQNHTVNYKGCETYQKIIKNRPNTTNRRNEFRAQHTVNDTHSNQYS